ncbi:tyrosine-type recombinase/integrase [Enterobacter bugandensis]|uniref:tyrosine-type recombinase/integrase n=1 Tax=Enterobacter bugandensis TaxID=881260 RepID=UPI000A8BB9CC|nr:integrase arm-type DNA-binding domain-containing protein [Enterobacter bugandensis]MCK7291749.1 integrase arm-type DNA-binding domain-containing protein [Enterobacter bugandensis]
MMPNARKVEAAKGKEKSYKLSDGGGLYLQVEPNGSRYWRMKYRFADKEKRLSFGVYPTVTLADARQKREDAKKLLAAGEDPGEVKKAKKQALNAAIETLNPFRDVALEWHKMKSPKWSEGYASDIIEAFEKDIFPHIGHRPIADIQPLELLGVLRLIEARGAIEKAKKVRQRCGEVFRYAIVTGRAIYNPAPDLASAILQDADWLMRLPADEIARQMETLTKGLSSDWQSRIIDLYQKMQAWVEARQAEDAAIENLRSLRQHQAETEQASKDNRVQFRELLSQNGGIVTPEMKALRAEYLEQQETAAELAGLITEKEEQLPVLANATGRKANAYVNFHHGITEECIDELLSDFFIFNGAELSSLLRMKNRQFERDSSAHIPGIIEGTNDADTLYPESHAEMDE